MRGGKRGFKKKVVAAREEHGGEEQEQPDTHSTSMANIAARSYRASAPGREAEGAGDIDVVETAAASGRVSQSYHLHRSQPCPRVLSS